MKFTSVLLGAALLGVQAGSASAALVTAWNWDTISQFDILGAPGGTQTVTNGAVPTWTSPTFVPGQNPSTTLTEAQPGRISWGSNLGSLDPALNAARSGIAWTNPTWTNVATPPPNLRSPPQLITNSGIWVNGDAATHYNQPIDISFATLASGIIKTTFNLYEPPNSISGGPIARAVSRSFSFLFIETPNGGGGFGGGGGCAGGLGTPTGSGGAGCSDAFILLSDPSQLVEQFNYNGVDYTLQVAAFDGPQPGSSPVIGPLSHDFCGFAQVQANPALALLCQNPSFQPFGFTTPESANTTIQFAFLIGGQEVVISEPSTLAMFGAALFGLGLIGWRRRAH